MRLRSSLPFRSFARSYATRRPERPPPKIRDPLLSSPNAEVHQLPDGMTFIHRPPPSAPSPFSTTLQPASPLLRPLQSSETKAGKTEVAVPPRMREERVFPDNKILTEEDFARMKELRNSDPEYWTRGRLAKKFKCPPFLVAQKASLDSRERKEKLEQREAEHEANRANWGENKSMVMAIRKKRRQYW